jgi:acetate kinase
MMGTRSGSVDPGILTYLVRQRHLSDQQLDEILNQKAGLPGISRISSDMRKILAASKKGHERAKRASLSTTALRWGHVVRYTPFGYILCRVPPTAAIM